VNVLAWFAFACRIDQWYRPGGLAKLDRTHDAVTAAPKAGPDGSGCAGDQTARLLGRLPRPGG